VRTSRRTQEKAEMPPATPAPAERIVTAQVWGRGRANEPIVRAFVGEQSRGRTMKRTIEDWNEMFREFREAPREA
jgi:hypothetical protein